MASPVDICNLALARLGDSATVASIDPPEGSAQAAQCARFYPMARDTLLEMHNWAFSTRRAALALLTSPSAQWDYAYAVPFNSLNILAVLPEDAIDDTSVAMLTSGVPSFPLIATGATWTPQPFSVETLEDGASVILTDLEDAWCRYSVRVTDSNKFSPLFVDALGWLLASHLAGPLIKGDAGAKAAATCAAMFMKQKERAVESDSNSRMQRATHVPLWVSAR